MRKAILVVQSSDEDGFSFDRWQERFVTFRLYTPDDFSQLYAIEVLCFQPPFRFGRRYMRQLVQARNTATWIAEEDGHMTGFAIVEWGREEEEIHAYIQTIEVKPEVRSKGIGRQLLSRVEDSAGDAHAVKIWLHVDATNKGAIRLYEAAGYFAVGREENYYAQGRDAFIYSKPMQQETVLYI
jgi:[ribosomal protein S18]-alanine N-acetyltransferase